MRGEENNCFVAFVLRQIAAAYFILKISPFSPASVKNFNDDNSSTDLPLDVDEITSTRKIVTTERATTTTTTTQVPIIDASTATLNISDEEDEYRIDSDEDEYESSPGSRIIETLTTTTTTELPATSSSTTTVRNYRKTTTNSEIFSLKLILNFNVFINQKLML